MRNYSKIAGSEIKKLRTNKNISLKDFAQLIHMSPQYLKKIEAGEVNIYLKTLEIICNNLDISLYEFLKNSGL